MPELQHPRPLQRDAASLRLIPMMAPGRGAVATVRIEGRDAVAAVARHFQARNGRPLARLPVNRLAVGHFGGTVDSEAVHDPNATANTAGPNSGEEVVVRRESDEAVELHCHGGLAAVARIQQILTAEGCRILTWQAWAADHLKDPIAAAAYTALAETRTQRTAAILLDQYQGALRRAMQEIETSRKAGRSVVARQQIDALLARAPVGLHLVHPWRVVVAGEPNVGKSSLVNALAGYRRAIVHATPGTTRDVVTLQTVLDGWPVELADTAGLHCGGDAVERAGIELARREMAAADLVVLVFDRSRPWRAGDQVLLDSQPGALVVHNKSDLPPGPGDRPPGLSISALELQGSSYPPSRPAAGASVGFADEADSCGIDELCRALAARLVPEPPPPGVGVPFTPELVGQIARL